MSGGDDEGALTQARSYESARQNRALTYIGMTDSVELGGALEPLFGPCPPDDLFPLAEADSRTFGAVLMPQPLETGIEVLQLLSHARIAAAWEVVPEDGATGTQVVDLGVDRFYRVHARQNARSARDIPCVVHYFRRLNTTATTTSTNPIKATLSIRRRAVLIRSRAP